MAATERGLVPLNAHRAIEALALLILFAAFDDQGAACAEIFRELTIVALQFAHADFVVAGDRVQGFALGDAMHDAMAPGRFPAVVVGAGGLCPVAGAGAKICLFAVRGCAGVARAAALG